MADSDKDKSPNEENNQNEGFELSSSQQMQVFENELKDIYWAENAFAKALPLMIENAPSSTLIDDLTSHLAETKLQVESLENVFLTFGKKAAARKCKAIVFLIKESEAIIKRSEKSLEQNTQNIEDSRKSEEGEFDQFDTLSQFMDTRVFTNGSLLPDTSLEEEKPTEENETNGTENEDPSQTKSENVNGD